MKSFEVTRWPLGVFTSVDTGLGASLDILSELDVPTIHLHAPSAAQRTPGKAASLLARLAEKNITISCIFAGFAGESYQDIPTVQRTVGLVPPATRAERLAELKELMDYAALLRVSAVGLHLGFVPHDPACSDYQQIVEVTREECDYAAGRGLAVHLETGQEPAAILLAFLQDVDRSNLFVNFDPANMILYGCGEPIPALQQIGPYVRSVHCKDACWSDQPGETWGSEVPLGEGDVDFFRFLQTLDKIGYTGPLTIEREIPQLPDQQRREIGQAVELLKSLRKPYLQ
jgi:sugar phosphate isomerase/epimerase